MPNPCTISPRTLVAAALDVRVRLVHGKPSVFSAHGFKDRSCRFTHGAAVVNVVVAPAGYGISGVTGQGIADSRPAGLGPEGIFDYGTYLGAPYANAQFINGPFWGSVLSTSHARRSRTLALARYVYLHLS